MLQLIDLFPVPVYYYVMCYQPKGNRYTNHRINKSTSCDAANFATTSPHHCIFKSQNFPQNNTTKVETDRVQWQYWTTTVLKVLIEIVLHCYLNHIRYMELQLNTESKTPDNFKQMNISVNCLIVVK
jgi:hypothetical protein